MSYIKREDVEQLLKYCVALEKRDGMKMSAEDILMEFNAISPADVKPVVRGEWYGESDGDADGCPVYDIWSCPCCGKYFDEWDEKPTWNFCPNCGADMREET